MTLPNSVLLGMMTALFLALGYLGVPVAFALIAGVLVGTLFTPITLQSMIAQLFNGVDSEALMAIPFFLLVGELMTSANVVIRIAELSQALVGHIRGGLARSPWCSRCSSPACPVHRRLTSQCCRAPWRGRWRAKATARNSPPP
jgi:TRAP-type mannitol/chloroaromatic compound transport system permease large subunit